MTSTVGAAMAGTRVLAPVEGDLLLGGAAVLAGATALALYAPRAIAWPLAALAGWSAIALLGSYVRGRRAHGRAGRVHPGSLGARSSVDE